MFSTSVLYFITNLTWNLLTWTQVLRPEKSSLDHVSYGLPTETICTCTLHHKINLIYEFLYVIRGIKQVRPAALSKVWAFFTRLNSEIMGSNPTQNIDICVRLFCVAVDLCVGSGLATGWSPVQRVILTVDRLRNWKGGKVSQGL
jgi:hypothetical protein